MEKQLTAPERSLLVQVSASIFANPFTSDRKLADCRITGLAPDTDNHLLLDRVMHRVQQQVEHLARQGCATILAFGGENRQLAGNLFLFHIFHRYLARLDDHIRKQNTTATPHPLSCGVDILRDLQSHGFTDSEADRYLALFFQMRRAYFFISQSLIGSSPCMQQLRARLWNNIFTHDIEVYATLLWNRLEDFSTLLLGETGTGKGLIAAATGRSGYIPWDRKKQAFRISFTEAFLAINLSQYSEQLIESELFGHARGAFTGAVQAHRGIFARSSPFGAVFLDEIGEVSIPVQVKLLRVLQERIFLPVGSTRQERFAGRVIAATNRDLSELRKNGGFRDDFFYRLSSDTITVPPLRQRIEECPEELEHLADHLLARITGRKAAQLADRVHAELQRSIPPDYPWPGNVRELEQCIRQLLLHGAYRTYTLQQSSEQEEKTDLARRIAVGTLTISELAAGYCCQLYEKYGTYQEVARRTGLDRRTVKKYLQEVSVVLG